MSNSTADHNLLFGLLALQNGLLTRDQLVAAFGVWVANKTRSLDEILVEQGALTGERQAQMKQMVAWHIQLHGHDAGQSLAAVSSASSACKMLAELDQDLQASLQQHLPSHQSVADPLATLIDPLAANTAKGRYLSLRPHAKGGLGEVSVALDCELHREVALKEIQPRFADIQESRERFVLEAEITGGLEHPGIVPVYGLGTYPDGRPFYAMRFIKGDSLKDALAQFHQPGGTKTGPGERQLQLRKLLARFIDVCNAIEYAHSRGVLHRDLKPGNIMLGKYGETLVVDWGLAKSVGRKDISSGEATLQPMSALSSSGVTQAGSAIGTPAYMSAEQAAGRLDIIGPVSDVYSLGATLYHVLTGRPPLEDKDVGIVLQRVQKGDIPRPRDRDPAISRALEAICIKAMALKPEDRYASPRILADEVERWLADEPVQAYRESWTQQVRRWGRRHRTMMTAGVVALVAAVTLLSVTLVLLDGRRRAIVAEQANTERERGIAVRERGEAIRGRQDAVAALYTTQMNSIQAAWENSRPDRMVELLDQVGPETAAAKLRGFEWYYWRRVCQRDQRVLSERSNWNGQGIAFSSDGTQLTSVTDGKTVTLWSTATGIAARTLVNQDKEAEDIACVAWSPDGKQLATAGAESSKPAKIWLWDLATGKVSRTFAGHTDRVVSLAFAPDGASVASKSDDHTVRVWDVVSGKEQRSLMAVEDNSIAFSPDSTQLFVSDSPKAKLWNLRTSGIVELATPYVTGNSAAAFSPDGQRLALGHQDRVVLWDLASNKEVRSFTGHGSTITCLAFSPDGNWIVSGGDDQTVRAWNLVSDEDHRTFKGHTSAVYSVAFSPDCTQVASSSFDWKVCLWNVLTDQQAHPVPIRVSEAKWWFVPTVALSPDSKRYVTASGGEGVLEFWDSFTGERTKTIQAHPKAINQIAISPSGKLMATASSDQTIKLWETRTGNELRRLDGHGDEVLGVTFNAEETELASTSGDATVKVWDLSTGQAIQQLNAQKYKSSWDRHVDLDFSPDGKRLAYAMSGTIEVLDRQTGQGKIIHGNNGTVTFSPDGTRVASNYDDRIILFDANTGTELKTLYGHTSRVTDICFSADGARIASGSDDKTIKLWDAHSGQELLTLKGHQSSIGFVKFSADGTQLASASWNELKFWDAPRDEEVITVLQGHESPVVGTYFNSDRTRMRTSDESGKFLLWQLPDGKLLADDGEHMYSTESNPNPQLRVLLDGKSVKLIQRKRDTSAWADDENVRRLLAPGYHKREAERAEATANWPGAVVHLSVLAAMEPKAQDVQDRLSEAKTQFAAGLARLSLGQTEVGGDLTKLGISAHQQLVYALPEGGLTVIRFDGQPRDMWKLSNRVVFPATSIVFRPATSAVFVLSADSRLFSVTGAPIPRTDQVCHFSDTAHDATIHPFEDRLAWCRRLTDDAPELIVRKFDGTDEVTLGFGYDPIWTADGKRLIYTGFDKMDWAIAIHEGSETKFLKIDPHPSINIYPTPTPDGQQIAFSAKGADGTMQIWLMSIDGSNRRQLTKTGDGNARPSFSPDGRYMAYIRGLLSPASVVVLNLETGEEIVVANDAQTIRPIWQAGPSGTGH